MSKLEFVRFGGLSPVDHKKFYKMDTFHSPPVKKGVYAFIYPYIEDFLWAWKVGSTGDEKTTNEKFKKYRFQNRRMFTYDGEIWVHWVDIVNKLGYGIQYNKDWAKIHTSNLRECFKHVKLGDRRELMDHKGTMIDVKSFILDPYKRGLGGFMSIDHLEVFIERVK